MPLESLLKLIEDKLISLIEPNAPLQEMAHYSLLSPGKRLRPLLTLVTATTFGASIEAALSPACALEFIHTYSLIHDDLPCMDNDDFRRGKPSLHKAYSEGHAVLTGDYLLTFAFQILSESPHLSATQKVQLIQLLSMRAGNQGMIGGQYLDIASQGQKISWETLHHLYLGKTAALITAALEFGGIIAHANPEEMQLLNQAGRDLGLAFQIIDDILDSDTESQKATNILFHMIKKEAQEKANALFHSATNHLSQLPHPTHHLQQLAQKLIYRTT